MKYERTFLADDRGLELYSGWIRSLLFLLLLAFGIAFWGCLVYLIFG